jgi:hypothetical protein
MIFDWRSRRYRGGSGWFQAGLVVTSVGLAFQPGAVGAIDITGSYVATIDLTGSYVATVDVTGSYVATVDIVGGADE